jgi:enoyl-CoA hydratase/carnithine racemase
VSAVLLERDPGRGGRLAWIVLNRPEVLNAIDNALAEALCAACEELSADDAVWVVILRGNGERAFCAGADIKVRGAFTDAQWLEQRALIRRMFERLRALPQPVIAAVHGYALGGGTEIALSADVAIAADDAQFGLTETRLGIIPGGGGTQLLPRLIGRNRAKELLLTARRVSAGEALALGMVTRVVPRAELLPAALALADEILQNSPYAVRQAKWAVNEGADLPLPEGLEREHTAYMQAIASADRREGIAAFNEKRRPRFAGR